MQTTFRPTTFDEIVGLSDIKRQLKYDLLGSRQRGIMPPHYLITGSPGVGKSTIAEIISKVTMGKTHKTIAAELNSVSKVHTLAANCANGDVIFLDEAHRLTDSIVTILLPWMEEGKIYGSANFKNNIAPQVSFILPTTNAGQLHKAFRQRCKQIHINPYAEDEIAEIIKQATVKSGIPAENICPVALAKLAKSSRGIPRIALEQRLNPLLNIMQVDQVGFTEATVKTLFKVNHIHPAGLETADITYCKALAEQMNRNNGAPVSHKTMCQITQMEPDVISNMIESFLVQEGIINIISRGRVLTPYGSQLLNLKTIINTSSQNQTQMSLYEEQEEPMSKSNNTTAVDNLMNTLDFTEIEKQIKAGEFKVQLFAVSNKISPADLRAAIVRQFGDKVGFFRGRSGGVRWVAADSASNVEAPAVDQAPVSN